MTMHPIIPIVTAALRSGKYRQIRGRFHDGQGGHCALGVIEAIGLDRRTTRGLNRSRIMLLNDSGATFDEIADLLEAGKLTVELEVDPRTMAELRRIAEEHRALDQDPDDEPPTAGAVLVVRIRPKLPLTAAAPVWEPSRYPERELAAA